MGLVHGTAGTVCTVLGFVFLGLAVIRFLWLSAPGDRDKGR